MNVPPSPTLLRRRPPRGAILALALLLALWAPPAAARGDDLAGAARDLGAEDVAAREQAVATLIQAGEGALAVLREVLAEPGPEARRLAARRAFAAITGLSPEAEGALERELEAAEEPLSAGELARRARAVLALGPRAGERALERAAAPGSEVPAELALRLAALRAVADLAAGSNAGDRAARALAEQGEPVLGELEALAADPELPLELRLVAAERLLALGGPRAFEPALTWLELEAEEQALATLGLRQLAADAPAQSFGAVAARAAALARRDAAAHRWLEGYAERVPSAELATALGSPEPFARVLAARALGRRGAGEAAETLARGLATQPPEVAAEYALALGRAGDRSSVEPLAGALAHGSAAVRRAAVDGLVELAARLEPDAPPGPPLPIAWIATALFDPDASVRARAARRLGETESAAAVGPLVAALDDAAPHVLAAATASLSALTGETAALLVSASGEAEREGARQAWRAWWTRDRDRGSESAGEGGQPNATRTRARTKGEGEGQREARLALEGGSALERLAGVLREQYRPYGGLAGETRTSPEALAAAAVAAMREVATREDGRGGVGLGGAGQGGVGPDEPGLALDPERRRLLRHLLVHGAFTDAAHAARAAGTLPLELRPEEHARLVHAAAQGMVRSLGDRFTRLLFLQDEDGLVDPDLLPAFFGRPETNGALLEREGDHVRVAFVFALTPACRAGLQRGDRVVTIDGKLAAGFDERRLERLSSERVTLAVLRDGWLRPVRFELVPEPLLADDLVRTALLPGDVGYVRLQHFALGSAQRVQQALRRLEERGARAFVLDMRGNPGGTIVDAAAVVDAFVPGGKTLATLTSNETEQEGEDTRLTSSDSRAGVDLPLAVLVNESSASAAELCAGALQDLERATVVGRTTWGKGIGQISLPIAGLTRRSILGDTPETWSLTMTVLEYRLPSGRSVQGLGVEPDVYVGHRILLGERQELLRRSREHPKAAAYAEALAGEEPGLALELARFDGWDAARYPRLAELRAELGFEPPTPLLREAVRARLRAQLAPEHPELALVDLQEDDDVRAAVAALAPELELDLAEHAVYADLAED